jgi:hypothetical protein
VGRVGACPGSGGTAGAPGSAAGVRGPVQVAAPSVRGRREQVGAVAPSVREPPGQVGAAAPSVRERPGQVGAAGPPVQRPRPPLWGAGPWGPGPPVRRVGPWGPGPPVRRAGPWGAGPPLRGTGSRVPGPPVRGLGLPNGGAGPPLRGRGPRIRGPRRPVRGRGVVGVGWARVGGCLCEPWPASGGRGPWGRVGGGRARAARSASREGRVRTRCVRVRDATSVSTASGHQARRDTPASRGGSGRAPVGEEPTNP